MTLVYLWAEDSNHVIGNHGRLPWHLPNDMRRFKQITTGHIILMGRKTYQSFPNGPLPLRQNVVLTHQSNLPTANNVIYLHNRIELQTFLRKYQQEVIYVIGGAQLFTLLASQVDYLVQTQIMHAFQGDVKMPPLNWSHFKLLLSYTYKVNRQNKWLSKLNVYQRIKEN